MSVTDLDKVYVKQEKYKTITGDEFLKLDKDNSLCFEICEGKLSDEFDDYFSEHDNIIEKDDIKDALTYATKIPVFKKDYFKLSPQWLCERIQDYLEDNTGYDSYEDDYLENIVGKEIFEDFAKKFNDSFHFYGAGEQVYFLDISKEFEEYLKERN